MTIVRAIDDKSDWLFGKGSNDYLRAVSAIEQDIATRLAEQLGNCFFNIGAGIDWVNLLGSKNQTALNLAIAAVILNTQNVTGILQLSISVTAARSVVVQYQVQTIYTALNSVFTFDVNG